eukprot:SAG11_NODE_239_length_11783_cov_52.724923_3_plen_88_part_00
MSVACTQQRGERSGPAAPNRAGNGPGRPREGGAAGTHEARAAGAAERAVPPAEGWAAAERGEKRLGALLQRDDRRLLRPGLEQLRQR